MPAKSIHKLSITLATNGLKLESAGAALASPQGSQVIGGVLAGAAVEVVSLVHKFRVFVKIVPSPNAGAHPAYTATLAQLVESKPVTVTVTGLLIVAAPENKEGV